MKLLPSYKKTYSLSLFLIIIILIAEAFLQFRYNLQPCLLAYIERILFLLLGITFFTARLHTQTHLTKLLSNWSIIFFSMLGIITAGRHVFLQHYPSTMMMPTITTSSEWLRILDIIKIAFSGTATCSQVSLVIGDISLATWSFLLFVCFTIIGFWQQNRKDDGLL